MIGRLAATVSSSSASSARSTRRSASSGSRPSTGLSRCSTPSSTSVMVATAVTGLVSDAMRKMADRASGAGSVNDGWPTTSTWTSSPWATSATSAGHLARLDVAGEDVVQVVSRQHAG